MCLAIPGRIVEIKGGEAVIDYGGVTRRASTRLCPEAREGDAALVHAGFIISLLDEASALELESIMGEIGDL